MRFNPNLAAVALEKLARIEKPAIVPADAAGIAPVDAGGPMGAAPGAPPGGLPPDAGAMIPGAGGPPLSPDAGAMMPGAGGPPPGGGGGDPGEQLASINSKLDQLIGTLNGFLMGQEAASGSKGSGGGGAKEQTALLQQIAQHMGIAPAMDPAAAGGAGMPLPPTGAGVGGVGVLPGMPGTPGAGADAVGGGGAGPGMSISADDRSGNGEPLKQASTADRVGRVLKNLRR